MSTQSSDYDDGGDVRRSQTMLVLFEKTWKMLFLFLPILPFALNLCICADRLNPVWQYDDDAAARDVWPRPLRVTPSQLFPPPKLVAPTLPPGPGQKYKLKIWMQYN